MKNDLQTMSEKLLECQKHSQRLRSAHQHLEAIFPLSLSSYLRLGDIDASFVDQMTFRFSKLQDTMGEKLFPLFLHHIGEPVKTMPFIDRINRLEELGLVDRDEWFFFRQERNEITHEYSFNQESIVEALNRIHHSVPRLIELFETFQEACRTRFNLDPTSPEHTR